MRKFIVLTILVLGSVIYYSSNAQEKTKAQLQMEARFSKNNLKKLASNTVVIDESNPRFMTREELPESINAYFKLRTETKGATMIDVDTQNQRPEIQTRNQHLIERVLKQGVKQ